MRTEQNIYKRNDGRWEGRYFKEYDKKGRIKYSSVYAKTYSEVKEKLQTVKSIFASSNKKHINIKFNILCYKWLESIRFRVKLSTYSRYSYMLEKYIIPFFQTCKIYEISSNSIEKIVKKNSTLSQKTLKDIISVFKQIISYSNERYNFNIQLKEYHFKKTNSKKVTALTNADQRKLECYLQKEMDLLKLGVLLCLYTGLRIGEICSLKWSDIDLSSGILKVDKTIQRIQNTDKSIKTKTVVVIDTPKSDCSIRKVPLSDFIISVLEKHMCLYTKSSYFLTGDFNYIEPRRYQYIFKKYLSETGIDDINFHALRHTFATRAIEQGVDIKSLSEILGHSSVNITLEKYVHSSMEQKKKQVNKLKPL